jgi:hypothetical protein
MISPIIPISVKSIKYTNPAYGLNKQGLYYTFLIILIFNNEVSV